MIDIHSHILPGLDDGSKTMEQSLGIIRQLQEAGFTTLVATPHVLEGRDRLSSEEILTATEQVRNCLVEAEISVEILPGAENYICPDLTQWARDQNLMTLGNRGKYLLVELPMLEIPRYTDQVFFELQVAGLTPVLAHPERNRGIVQNPERLLQWAKGGILFQLDLRSLSGKYGPEPKELAKRMLHSDLVHLLGSDAHRVAGSTESYLKDIQSMKEIIGEERFQEVTQKNPQKVLVGEALMIEKDYTLRKPISKKKSKFWDLFRK